MTKIESFIYFSEILRYNHSMMNEFSIAKNPAAASISLKTLWVVKSDSTYDVIRGSTETRSCVLIRTTAGQGRIHTDEAAYTADSGTLLILDLNTIRRYYCSGDVWDFWWFEFLTSEKPGLPMNRLLHTPLQQNEAAQVDACMTLLREDDWIAQHLASSNLSVLLYTWLRNSGHAHDSLRLYDKEMREAAFYMQNHLGERIRISDLARKSGLCTKRFSQHFQSVYQIPPKKYFDQLRMQAAETMLRSTGMLTAEIAENLGYSSSFHFTREFKKHYGTAPSNYRKQSPTFACKDAPSNVY